MPKTGKRSVKNNALDRSFQSQIILLQNSLVNIRETSLKRAIDLWCLRLSKATDEEKHARNTLTVLMQNQLIEKGTLPKEFLKAGNVRRDLNDLLQEINNEWQAFKSKWDSKSESPKDQTFRQSVGKSESNDIKDLEENQRLRRELEQMKLKLKRSDLRLQELEVKLHRQHLKNTQRPNETNEKEHFLKTFINIIAKFLHKNEEIKQKANDAIKLNLFLNIFSQLKEDDIGAAIKLKDFDIILESKLQAYIGKEKLRQSQKINEKLIISSTKLIEDLRRDHLRQLSHIDWQNATKLKLLKVKAYSKLRSVFIDLLSGKQTDITHVHKHFEIEFERLLKQLKSKK